MRQKTGLMKAVTTRLGSPLLPPRTHQFRIAGSLDIRSNALILLAFLLFVAPHPALAQDNSAKAVIDETAQPPLGQNSDDVAKILADQGAQSKMTYATKVTGDLAEGYKDVLKPKTRPEDEPSQPDLPRPGSLSTGVVILLVLAAVLLWLRFGGAGMLMARTPVAAKKPVVAPEAWNISDADQTNDPRSLLEQIALMPDRAAAMVRLLRHCLLTAAGETDTRLARADTERIALRRLPESWRAIAGLREILNRTELAHYGGRKVSEAEFARSLDLGRSILLHSHAKGSAHA